MNSTISDYCTATLQHFEEESLTKVQARKIAIPSHGCGRDILRNIFGSSLGKNLQVFCGKITRNTIINVFWKVSLLQVSILIHPYPKLTYVSMKAPLCFLETMHLEESWPIDREALSYCYMNVVVCKYVLPTRNIYCFALLGLACLLIAFCLHVTVTSSSRATVSHSGDNWQSFSLLVASEYKKKKKMIFHLSTIFT